MNSNGQHIGRLFTFFAGLIILAHAVVPHHHHFEGTHSSEQELTCESPAQEKSNEEENTDFHCHAFNILIVEKTTQSSLNHSLPGYFNFCLAGINANIEIPPFKNVNVTFFGYQVIFLKQFFFTAHTFRGPPEIASLLFQLTDW